MKATAPFRSVQLYYEIVWSATVLLLLLSPRIIYTVDECVLGTYTSCHDIMVALA